MKTTVTGRHVEMSSELRALIHKKLEPLERRLSDSAVSVQVVLSRPHRDCMGEVVLHARGDHMLGGEGEGKTRARAICAVADKVDEQAYTLKGKRQGRRRRACSVASDVE